MAEPLRRLSRAFSKGNGHREGSAQVSSPYIIVDPLDRSPTYTTHPRPIHVENIPASSRASGSVATWAEYVSAVAGSDGSDRTGSDRHTDQSSAASRRTSHTSISAIVPPSCYGKFHM